jgi:MoaA/NifB/PqqE/SkfB family radical SAM enzyme
MINSRLSLNGIDGWLFSDDEIDKAHQNNEILMLDMELGVNCSLNCNYCFRKNDERDKESSEILSTQKILSVISEAKKMGAKSVHLVGKGEPTEHPDFFKVMKYISDLKMIPLVFTAGHIFGNDKLAMFYHKMTGKEMAKKLHELGASVIVKVNSRESDIQNKIVGDPVMEDDHGEKHGYAYYRDIGLERLIEVGFNKHNPTRLGVATVILKDNFNEIFDNYVRFRKLNIYPIVNTFVPCGKTKTKEESEKIDVKNEQKIELWKKIYSFNIENGMKYQGVSSYCGGHICSQLGYAMYINVWGEVFDCPASKHKLGNAEEQSIKELWNKSTNRNIFGGNKDNYCPYRLAFGSLPKNLLEEVDKHLKRNYPQARKIKTLKLLQPKNY